MLCDGVTGIRVGAYDMCSFLSIVGVIYIDGRYAWKSSHVLKHISFFQLFKTRYLVIPKRKSIPGKMT